MIYYFYNIDYIALLFLESAYVHHSGCVEGIACSDGKFCVSDNICTACSFDDCKTHAENANAVAFAYRGTASKFCKLCNPSQLQDLRSYSDWGLYTKQGKL